MCLEDIFMSLKWFMFTCRKWGWRWYHARQGDGPSRTPQNKGLKPSNVFKDYERFLRRDDKHMLLKISSCLWLENKVWCSKAWSKGEIVQKITNKNKYFWNEDAELWTDGNVKFLTMRQFLLLIQKIMLNTNMLNEILDSIMMKNLK